MAGWLRKLRRALFNEDPSYCDMYEDAHARAAAEEYLGHIRRHLRERFGQARLRLLDAGCQAGRLLVPLAEDGHDMTGLDPSRFNLRQARRHTQEQQVTVRLIRGTIAQLPRWVRPASLDGIICTEVLYLCPDFRTLLQTLAERVRPGGLLCVSHRPNLHYVATALLRGDPEQAATFLQRSEGPSTDGAYHNWQTPEQLAEMYRSLDLRLLGCYPVDHSAHQLNLAAAGPEVQRSLDAIRGADAACRIPAYWLVVAEKPL
ncbi:MAG: methyltransferase domain-containing protein [Candidatus Omnitrophica bacterium]|nr:methyltransferase domain-containing protein [Candidatus Omnitrophota bacterium]